MFKRLLAIFAVVVVGVCSFAFIVLKASKAGQGVVVEKPWNKERCSGELFKNYQDIRRQQTLEGLREAVFQIIITEESYGCEYHELNIRKQEPRDPEELLRVAKIQLAQIVTEAEALSLYRELKNYEGVFFPLSYVPKSAQCDFGTRSEQAEYALILKTIEDKMSSRVSKSQP